MSTTELPRLQSPQDLWRLDGNALATGARDTFTQIWGLQARLGSYIAEVDARGANSLYGYGSTKAWVQALGRMTEPEAKNVCARALATHPGRGLDGASTPAVAPLTGDAAAEGAIGPQHIDRILCALKSLPATVSAEDKAAAERILVTLARDAGPGEIAKKGEELTAILDPDGPEPNDDPPGEQRPELRLRERKDGWWDIHGRVDPITGSRLRKTLDPLAKPRPAGEERLPDLRSPAERDGEAFGEVMALVQNAPDISAADRAQLLVTISLDGLVTGLENACLDLVTRLSATETRMLACDCAIAPIVLGTAGEPLDVGRTRRLITPAQRKALTIRDRGCAFPSCDRKPRYCDGHHVTPWYHGGPTDLRNLVLLCARHHRLVHKSDWQVRIAPDGLPEFTPPAWVDPLRKPRRSGRPGHLSPGLPRIPA